MLPHFIRLGPAQLTSQYMWQMHVLLKFMLDAMCFQFQGVDWQRRPPRYCIAHGRQPVS